MIPSEGVPVWISAAHRGISGYGKCKYYNLCVNVITLTFKKIQKKEDRVLGMVVGPKMLVNSS